MCGQPPLGRLTAGWYSFIFLIDLYVLSQRFSSSLLCSVCLCYLGHLQAMLHNMLVLIKIRLATTGCGQTSEKEAVSRSCSLGRPNLKNEFFTAPHIPRFIARHFGSLAMPIIFQGAFIVNVKICSYPFEKQIQWRKLEKKLLKINHSWSCSACLTDMTSITSMIRILTFVMCLSMPLSSQKF